MHACVCACVRVLLPSTVISVMSVFDGSLHTEHMDAYMDMYLVSSVCVTLKFRSMRVRFTAFVSVLLPFIFLSGWLNTHMPVLSECVCLKKTERESERAHAVLWVCVCPLPLSVCLCVCLCVSALAPCVCGCEVKCLLAGLGWRAGGEQR